MTHSFHCNCHRDSSPPPGSSRRTFLRHASLAAGASLLGAASPVRLARAGGHTNTLLLSYMDFRLMNSVEHYMSARGLAHDYDHIVLAGAALGALTDRYPAWNRTFWEHLDVAIQLHGIHRVIVMDHRDCGAYKTILGEDFAVAPEREKETHRDHLERLAEAIRDKHPSLAVELLLMALDGSVETLGSFA